jgi:phage shock protein E
MNFLELIFGNGATIIDVRTKVEFQSGHLKNSINIPIDKLQQNIGKIKRDKPVVTCCASGARSASARRMLKSNGFEQVYNGGSWYSLRKYTK